MSSLLAPRGTTVLSWVGSQSGFDQLFTMGAMSTAVSSSPLPSWSSESGLPGDYETGGVLRAFCGWNLATAISGTCHFAMLLASTLLWRTDLERPRGGEVRIRSGSYL